MPVRLSLVSGRTSRSEVRCQIMYKECAGSYPLQILSFPHREDFDYTTQLKNPSICAKPALRSRNQLDDSDLFTSKSF